MAASEQLQLGFMEEWSVDERPLSSVADVICGQHLLPHEQAETGIPYITGPADFSDRIAAPSRFSSVRRAMCLPGDVLLTVKGSGLGKVNLAPSSPAVIGRQLFALRPHARVIGQIFLWRVLQHTLADIKGTTSSTTVPGIGRDVVQALRIPLPPLSEQRRIVARIEELAARIERARGLQRRAIEDRCCIMPAAVTKALAGLESLAEDATVESVAQSVTDGNHQPPPKAESGIPFVFISNIISGRVNLDNCKWVAPDYFASLTPERIPQRGDILYTAVGSYGIPCLVDIDDPFCFQRHIAIIKPDQSRILPRYLMWVLSSSDVYAQATQAATGSAQLTVPLRAIRKLHFPLPSLEVQQSLDEQLGSIQTKASLLEHLQAESAAELDALLPAILTRAFRGEL